VKEAEMIYDGAEFCRFYVSYTGIKPPLKLVNPLDADELRNRNTFIRAYYDKEARLIAFEKVVYGEIELSHRYEYHPGGALKRAEIGTSDDDVRVMCYDESGVLAGCE
jgi:hypothetical protein